MASSTGIPAGQVPMDVEDSMAAPTATPSGDSSSSNSNSIVVGPEGLSGAADAAAAAAGPHPPPAAVAIGSSTVPTVGNWESPENITEPEDGSNNIRGDGSRFLSEAEQVELPSSFDLEAYVSRYSGHTKMHRLDWLSQRCPSLAPECFKVALALLRQGNNTAMYREMCARASGLLGSEYAADKEWIEQADRKYKLAVDRLELELNSYKTNLIKESIRMGYNELGELSYRRGDLQAAFRYYVRTRDYCTTNRHSVEMCLHVIEVSADMRNFTQVQNYISKAEHIPDLDVVVAAKLRAAYGLFFLERQEYAKAARKLVHVSPELGSTFDCVVSPEDVAVYGGLCALATFGRDEMKRQVLDNASFKNFLDLVPQVRELLNDFANSRYKSCLSYLARMKGELQLDIYLYRSLKELYKLIEDKCITQYFSPYVSVRLESMAEAFGMQVPEMEKKVAALILSNQISARIDSTRKTLHAKQADQRAATCRKMLEMGEEYRRELQSMLIRMSCIEHDFIVRSGRASNVLQDRLHDGQAAMEAGAMPPPLGQAAQGNGTAGATGAGGGGHGGVATHGAGCGPDDAREEVEDAAGGADAERPPEAGGGASSTASATHDAMDTVT